MGKRFLILISVLLLFSWIVFFVFNSNKHIQHNPQNVIYRADKVEIIVSPCPLIANSLSVQSISPQKSIITWDKQQHVESYNLLQNTATIWKEQEFIEDFMVMGKIPPRMMSDRFFWEIIPFAQNRSNFIDHFWVAWGILFNSPCLSEIDRQALKNKYNEFIPVFEKAYTYISEKTSCPDADVFCHQDVINRQRLYDGKLMMVLYNYAPLAIGEDKLHFLIIPKSHRTGFPDLTLDEYLEAQEIASKLINYYEEKGFPIVYLYHKTGKYAGQTVPHWHEHVIFASDKSNEILAKWIFIGKKLFGSKPLSEKELEVVVKKYSQQVQEAMK